MKFGLPRFHIRTGIANSAWPEIRLWQRSSMSGCAPHGMRFVALATLWGAVIAGCGDHSPPPNARASQQPSDPVVEMHQAMLKMDWKLAAQHAPSALIARPNDPDLITDVAKVTAMNGDRRKASQMLIEAAKLASYEPASRVDFAVKALVDVGELYSAMELLESSLAVHPERASQRRTLIGFLGEAQRTELIQPHLYELIRQRSFDFPLLVTVTETSTRRFLVSTIAKLLERNPNDHRVRLGEAYDLIDRHDSEAAAAVLTDILEHHPDFAPAYAHMGQVLVQQRKFTEITDWMQNAPDQSQTYPEYWLTLGDWATERSEFSQACHAYWKAANCDPNHSGAWGKFSQSLRLLDQSATLDQDTVTAKQLGDIDRRIGLLLELRSRFYSFAASGRKSQKDAVDVAESLVELGRNWEAEAWTAAAMGLTENQTERLVPLRETVLNRLRNDTTWQSTKDQPALQLSLDRLPEVDVHRQPSQLDRPPFIPQIASSEHLRFTNESESWALGSIGGKNNPSDARLAALIRSTGVGGASIDYDLDGWQDLVVMGAGGTMLQLDSMPNELLRNTDAKFKRVTDNAGVTDTAFGQGVATGDINEDGFPDLFFANLGHSGLYVNNGDGTFTNRTTMLGDSEPKWTTSAAFVDLSGDGLTDLLTTNYCKIVPHLDKACPNEDGILGPCHPLKFAADNDRFYLNRGDGHLLDNSQQWIPHISPGRGLGIVAGKLDGTNLGVLIANDMSANHFYTHSESQPSLIESAAARGVAVDERTMTQASMGIAASDFDNDGKLDFYITGFAREYNILYEQRTPGCWRDQTGRSNLIEPTLMTVGFGTQAVDMDNDGIDEIFVTNGHIGDFDDPTAPPYEQPLQIFRRDQQGGFELINDDSWGNYFSTSHVGRALWTMDVNRDGDKDVLITHTYEPICLLVNHSKPINHKIAFRLVATQNSRDAIGATVHFTCGGQPRTLWVLAGDGYFCANERILRLGLGNVTQVEDVTVTWQDGSSVEYGTLAADAEYLLVENEKVAFQEPF